MANKETQIQAAIQGNHLIKFNYQGYSRVAEPHLMGELNGIKAILAYQVDGESSSAAIPGYRRFNLDSIRDLEILPFTFKSHHSSWDQIYQVARGE